MILPFFLLYFQLNKCSLGESLQASFKSKKKESYKPQICEQ